MLIFIRLSRAIGLVLNIILTLIKLFIYSFHIHMHSFPLRNKDQHTLVSLRRQRHPHFLFFNKLIFGTLLLI